MNFELVSSYCQGTYTYYPKVTCPHAVVDTQKRILNQVSFLNVNSLYFKKSEKLLFGDIYKNKSMKMSTFTLFI